MDCETCCCFEIWNDLENCHCCGLGLVSVFLVVGFEWERDCVLLWDFVVWSMMAFFAEECLCTPYLPGSFFVCVDIVVVEACDMML